MTRELDCGVMASDVNSQLFSCIVSTISVLWQGFWDKVTNQFVAKHFILFFFHETDEDIFCQSLLLKVICSLTKLVPLNFHIWCTFPSMYDHIISGRCHQIPANEKNIIFSYFNWKFRSFRLFLGLAKFFVILNQDHIICYNQYHIELLLSIQSQEEPWAIITIVFIFRHASVSRTYPGTYNRQDPHITARIHNITARILI